MKNVIRAENNIEQVVLWKWGATCYCKYKNGSWEIFEWASLDITQPSNEEVEAAILEYQAILDETEPMRLLREERNRRIAETDWWASSDLTMTEAQTAYRQALRDITDTYQSLDTVVWPVKPS
mgnify:CR=1 FL=1